jgi:hypothetical protein
MPVEKVPDTFDAFDAFNHGVRSTRSHSATEARLFFA